jgi:hypothetical protein
MTAPKLLRLVEGALTQSKACLQLQVEDIIKDHEVRPVIYKAVCGIAKTPNRVDDVNVILVLIVWQKTLLHALPIETPLLLLQNRHQSQVKCLILGEVHKI